MNVLRREREQGRGGGREGQIDREVKGSERQRSAGGSGTSAKMEGV